MNREEAHTQFAERRVGTTLCGKWHVDATIGAGSMAVVFAATHRNGNRVAIKMLYPEIAINPAIRRRFLREGYVSNKVEHPGAVLVTDDDKAEDGAVFLVMELLEGKSVEEIIVAEKKLTPAALHPIAEGALEVLGAAHAKGIIHRDIKPANVFVTNSKKIKVLDFGLARLAETTGERTTAPGFVMGTTAYMPPEQAMGQQEKIDGRTDIFALGALMFRALTGKYVHAHASKADRRMAAMTEQARPLLSIDPALPPPIARVVDKALAFSQHDRWQTADDMRFALTAALDPGH